MKKPVFIIGCPRSGTSITLDIMASHNRFAWISDALNKSPQKLIRSIFNNIYKIPYIGFWLYKHKNQSNRLVIPTEAWEFWCYYLNNFRWQINESSLPRRHCESDISDAEVIAIYKTVSRISMLQFSDRFLSKYTDFPRISYITKAFPDAIFIHIVRDGRAVAYSYMQKINENVFGTWDERSWWIKGWPEEWRTSFLNKYNTPLALVAFQWKYFLKMIYNDLLDLPKDRYCEVNYRDIIGEPEVTFNKIFQFCQLDMGNRVRGYIKQLELNNMNQKWRQELNKNDQSLLNEIVCDSDLIRHLDNL